jgi:hypothetical protein
MNKKIIAPALAAFLVGGVLGWIVAAANVGQDYVGNIRASEQPTDDYTQPPYQSSKR